MEGGSSRKVSDDNSSDRGPPCQLFTSIPALNDAASYLAQTTSYLTRRMTGCVEEADDGQELTSLCSEESRRLSFGSWSAFSGRSSGASPSSSVHDDLGKNSKENLLPDRSEAISSRQNLPYGTSLFQGLINRAVKTVRGSADDIGWLQRDGSMPLVKDETKRFTELLDNIRNHVHKLPNSVVYLLVPGLFSNHGPLYFVNVKTCFSKMGLTCHIAKIHSEASVATNANQIKEYIEEMYWGSKKQVLLLGHSKGGVDAAAAISLYWPELRDKVAGLVLAQSPYGGSPIATDILRDGQLGDYVNLRKLMEILISKVIKGDIQALDDLTYERRRDFLKKHPLPLELPVVSFHTEASIGPGILSSLSRVAHAELPGVAALADLQPTMVPVVMPLGAAMAACAQILQLRYGEKSDGLVTRRDAEVPGSFVVRPSRKLDHAWMVYSSLNDDPGEADASQVCEALLTLLVEVGRKKRHEIAMKDN